MRAKKSAEMRRRRGESEQGETSRQRLVMELSSTHTHLERDGASRSPSCSALSSSSSCRRGGGLWGHRWRHIKGGPRAQGARCRHFTSKAPCRGDECGVRGPPGGSEALQLPSCARGSGSSFVNELRWRGSAHPRTTSNMEP